jgi:hypothetical protein
MSKRLNRDGACGSDREGFDRVLGYCPGAARFLLNIPTVDELGGDFTSTGKLRRNLPPVLAYVVQQEVGSAVCLEPTELSDAQLLTFFGKFLVRVFHFLGRGYLQSEAICF